MTSILGWFFDRVMASRWRRFREDRDSPAAAQERRLRTILALNAGTAFGREHDFVRIARLPAPELRGAYRKAVPIRSYGEFTPFIERMKKGEADVLIPGLAEMFSLTSGTASEPKFCPVNRAFILELHSQHLLWMYNAYRQRPAVNSGKYLVMASPAEMGLTAGGIPYGSMSGKQLASQSIPIRRRMAAPWRTQLLADPNERLFTALAFAMARDDLRVVTSVNPSTLVLIAERMAAWSDRLLEALKSGRLDLSGDNGPDLVRRLGKAFRPVPARARRLDEIKRTKGVLEPRDVWPNLATLFTWQGGAAAFFLPRTAETWGEAPMRCLGLRASEGNFTIPLRESDPAGVLGVGGHYMEFVPAETDAVGADTETVPGHELEEGKTYRLIVTTSGGFYRYDLADLVETRGRSFNTPEVAFIRRAGATLSATGEKIAEDQVVKAMEKAGAGLQIVGFTLTWELDDGLRYVLAVELPDGASRLRTDREGLRAGLSALAERFDRELRAANLEYEAKRADGRIGRLRALLLADGSYRAYRDRAAEAGRPENQVKPPHLAAPPSAGKAPIPGCPFLAEAEVAFEA